MSNSFFVCYAREDYEYVASFKLELDNQLEIKSENLRSNTNIDLKIDQSPGTINLGEKYRDKIEKIIEESSGAILFLSKNFVRSQFINEVEIPKILEQKRKDNDYLILPIFVDSAEGVNEEISLYQAPNSEKNPLKELNGELRGLIVKKFVKELVEEISSKQTSANKVSKKFFNNLQRGFGWSLIAITLLAYFFFTTSDNEEINTDVINPNPQETLFEISDMGSETVCVKNMFELFKYQTSNFIATPPEVDTFETWKVDCSKLHGGELFHQIEKNYMDPDNFTFAERSAQADSIDVECKEMFNEVYGFSYTYGPYKDASIRFLNKNEKKLIVYCIAVKEMPNKPTWQDSEGLVADFNINRYKQELQFEEDVRLIDYERGDCGLFPDWWWIDSDVDFNTGIYEFWVRTDCNAPHYFEVIEIFNYHNDPGLSKEKHESNIFEKCFASADLYSGLDEVSSTQSILGTHQEIFAWGDTTKFGNGEPIQIYCLQAFGDLVFYKVDFSIEQSFEVKKYTLNNNKDDGVPTVSINNCPSEVLATYQSSEYYADTYWFNISWSNLENPLESFYIKFDDPVYGYTQESLDLSKDQRYFDLLNWEMNFGISYEILENHEYGKDKGSFEIGVIFNNDQKITDTCTFDLKLQDEN